MGQRIAVTTRRIGNIAVLIGDRNLTSQDGETFASWNETRPDGTPASMLANRIFDIDSAINHISAQSNTVVVKRDDVWDTSSLANVASVLETLFVYWDDQPAHEPIPVEGEGHEMTVTETSADRSIGTGLGLSQIESLRSANYNATITSIKRVHDTLWIIAVTPDGDLPSYSAGQYATLGLGFWEPRIDDRQEDLADEQIAKLARRSYSISSSILAANGELLSPTSDGSLEFYVVLVEKDSRETSAILTPRLFVKDVGDRIFLGRKMAGRYRLDKLTSHENNVVLLATGTGEAPHNAMVLDLLRDGHLGQIVSVCTSRYLRDLAYLDTHRRLMERFNNYHYLAVTTREPENEGNKVYIQDLIESGGLDEALGGPLDPENTHVFLCGNPAMIGLPEWDGDTPEFPSTKGAVEVLIARGFTLDRRGVAGNIHYEEYW